MVILATQRPITAQVTSIHMDDVLIMRRGIPRE